MEVNTKRAKRESIGLSLLNLNAGTETEEKRSYEKDVFNDYDRSEKDLEKLEAHEYFDFVSNSGSDLKVSQRCALYDLMVGLKYLNSLICIVLHKLLYL